MIAAFTNRAKEGFSLGHNYFRVAKWFAERIFKICFEKAFLVMNMRFTDGAFVNWSLKNYFPVKNLLLALSLFILTNISFYHFCYRE